MSMRSKVRRRPAGAAAPLELFAPTSAGLEQVLARELEALGARSVEVATRGVAFRGSWETVYKANLWLRTAHRVLVRLAEFDAGDREQLYGGARSIDWGEQMSVDQTLAVDAVSHRSEISHTQFASRVVKDAVVDWFRDRVGRRPSIDPRGADLRINARLRADRCTISIDTSGQRLHRRGYRPTFGVEAPLKENLAAGVLLLSGYDGSAPLVDPMCGSGTLLVEAALIARNVAPGLLGRDFGFMRHPRFDPVAWKQVRREAREAVREVEGCPISGADVSPEAVRAARAAVSGAGVDDVVIVRQSDLSALEPRAGGRVVSNPPYGDRLGEIKGLAGLYETIGDVLKRSCAGMTAHLLVGSKFLAGRIGLRPSRRDVLWNGPIECRLLHFDIY
jgi:putative N6-adenine-specific DNA methylase